MRRSQFTLEFMMIFVLAFFIFLLLLALIVRMADQNRTATEKKKIELLADTVKNDLMLAYQSGQSFETQLSIPDNLDGSDFEIEIDNGADILYVSNPSMNVSVFRSIPDVSGCLKKGCTHNISKENNVIQIVPISPCTC